MKEIKIRIKIKIKKKLQGVLGVLLGLCATLATAQPAATRAEADCLSLRDGDTLYGKLLEVQPGNVVRWQHPDASEPIEFKAEGVAQIDFAPQVASAGHTHHSCTLWLTNGDALPGELGSCDRDGLTLDTWYAGRLKIPRRALQTVAFNPRTPVIVDGLTGLEGWTQGKSGNAFVGEAGKWSYRNGAFYADKAASIARDVSLPARSEIQFDVAWKGPLNLAIALYTDSLQPIRLDNKEKGPDFGGFYSLRISSPFVTLTAITKREPLRPLGDPLIVQPLTQKDRVHVDVCVSKAERRVALLMDGKLIKDWIDAGGFTGEGTGIRFVNNQGGILKLSHVRVSKWNGVLDEAATVPADPSRDAVLMESGAKVAGAIVSVADGRISLLTTGGTTNIPLGSARAIEFARFQGQSAPPGAAANTRATFVQGGSVTFELLGWRADGITGISPELGKVRIDPSAIGRLEFLPAESAKAEDRKN